MSRKHSPRRGSMAYSPRRRAKRIYARLRSWPESSEPKILGFSGYKAGMTHFFMLDDIYQGASAGKEVFTPVTVLDCPPIFPFLIRSYSKTPYGLKTTGQVWWEKPNKDLKRKIPIPKKPTTSQKLTGDELSIIAHTMPRDSGVDKKTPEIMEYKIGGKSFEEKSNYAKELLGKPIKVSEILNEGDYIDVTAVTKGKGTQGPVKRFGIKIQNKKARRGGKGRHVGSLGDRGSPTRWTVPQAGQTGYQTRTEFNKRILKIGTEGKEITPKGGFLNYGIVEHDYVVVKGSIPGPAKRLVRIRPAMRKHPASKQPQVTFISLSSKQGR